MPTLRDVGHESVLAVPTAPGEAARHRARQVRRGTGRGACPAPGRGRPPAPEVRPPGRGRGRRRRGCRGRPSSPSRRAATPARARATPRRCRPSWRRTRAAAARAATDRPPAPREPGVVRRRALIRPRSPGPLTRASLSKAVAAGSRLDGRARPRRCASARTRVPNSTGTGAAGQVSPSHAPSERP